MKEQVSQLAKSAVVQYVSNVSYVFIGEQKCKTRQLLVKLTSAQVAWVLNLNDFSKLTKSYNRFTGNCFCLSGSSGLIEQTSLAIPTY